jgi:hypothetical protein
VPYLDEATRDTVRRAARAALSERELRLKSVFAAWQDHTV